MIEAETSPQESAPRFWSWQRRSCSPVAPSNQPPGPSRLDPTCSGSSGTPSAPTTWISTGIRAPPRRFSRQWSKDARVFEDALPPAGYTLPAHASMFTGLYPSEHCTNNDNARLDDSYTTIAELLKGGGLPDLPVLGQSPRRRRPGRKFRAGVRARGASLEPQWAEQALRLVRAKVPAGRPRRASCRKCSPAAREGRATLVPANIKAAGEIAKTATLGWLASTDARQPFFIFLNYMEAQPARHPASALRRGCSRRRTRIASYRVDRSWGVSGRPSGCGEYSDDEIMLTRSTSTRRCSSSTSCSGICSRHSARPASWTTRS